jgi:hypothetical protein
MKECLETSDQAQRPLPRAAARSSVPVPASPLAVVLHRLWWCAPTSPGFGPGGPSSDARRRSFSARSSPGSRASVPAPSRRCAGVAIHNSRPRGRLAKSPFSPGTREPLKRSRRTGDEGCAISSPHPFPHPASSRRPLPEGEANLTAHNSGIAIHRLKARGLRIPYRGL